MDCDYLKRTEITMANQRQSVQKRLREQKKRDREQKKREKAIRKAERKEQGDSGAIHAEAMDLAEKAVIARTQGDTAAAQKYLKDALQKEQHAARIAVETEAPEPTRSILLKSAAHLAIECGETQLAEKLISTALAGDPPAELVHELRTML